MTTASFAHDPNNLIIHPQKNPALFVQERSMRAILTP
jgi:hypothetical protein